ncbi:MAG: DUF4114 domain-containing protein [Acidobacteria bacterium]|nr:DUF4114 domain-containing protein [Acidobacteriota bacterium]
MFLKRSVLFCLSFTALLIWAADDDDYCAKKTKEYNQAGFSSADFVGGGSGLLFDSSIHPDPGSAIDLDNIVFPTNQPFYADYLSEGAGASHLFGFFFLDIDTNKNGYPDFFEIGPDDDLDGDGIINSVDLDDDGDGIPDIADNRSHANLGLAADEVMPASIFRNGTAAAAAGEFVGDFWQFVPNNLVNYTMPDSSIIKIFEHPGAYLYIDKNKDQIPDILQYTTGSNKVPPYCVDRGYFGKLINRSGDFPGMLGTFLYSGSNGSGAYHWTGSTIYYIADDDGGTGQVGDYLTYTPYGNKYSDIYGSADANVDYDIYGTNNNSSPLIPAELKANDKRGVKYWKYRWYQGNVSGGREFVFFLVVFYPSGSSNVNTYFSKSGFNPDTPPSTPNPNGATTGDYFGDTKAAAAFTGQTNWYPRFNNTSDHNLIAAKHFGGAITTWAQIASVGANPVAINPANQEWVDRWENFTSSRRIVQYRGLADWFNATPVDANTIINGRYGIDMSGEGDSSIIRAINGNMAHLMVGAPAVEPEAWLLGWEDLFGGGDRDFEDVVFYVKREARGTAQSTNIASDLDQFDDVSLTSVTFHFEDNFTNDKWGTEGTYINYFYRLSSTSDWIPLLGGEHLRTPDLFTTTVEGGKVIRDLTLTLTDPGQKAVYWMVEMNSADVDSFVPEITIANVGYEALVHAFYYNSAVLASSNIDYYGAYETPSITWKERKNRGHLYALKTFDHGNPPVVVPKASIISPELTPTSQPTYPYQWDAGVSILSQVTPSTSNRKILTYTKLDPTASYSKDLTVHEFSFGSSLDSDVVDALNLSPLKVDGVLIDNFQDPTADEIDFDAASQWLAAWVHGYMGAIAGVSDPGAKREWVFGGINRAAPLILRQPGIPVWLPGSGIPVAIKQDYLEWLKKPEQKTMKTRLLIGSEAGMIHAINGGRWIDGLANTNDIYADGYYSSFGDGSEVWAMIPANLLDDIKYNYTGQSAVNAKIDTTGISSVIYDSGNWRRICVFAQGENGGNFKGRTGNVVFAMDMTDPDDPKPLWEYSHDRMQNLLYPLAMSWSIFDGAKEWVLALSTGATPVVGTQPGVIFLNPLTGEQKDVVNLASTNATISGAPAMVDVDGSGYANYAYVGSSDGRLIAINIDDRSHNEVQIPGKGFWLAPNVRSMGDGTVLVTAVSGDSPLTRDEGDDVQNYIYVYTHTVADGTWTLIGTFKLPKGHKAFARPRLVGTSLVVGTTTGDTYSFCDPDPDDLGALILIKDVFNIASLDPDTAGDGWEQIGIGGTGDKSYKAPVTVINGVIRAHDSFNMAPNPKPNIPVNRATTIGNVFGVVGWDEPLLDSRDF